MNTINKPLFDKDSGPEHWADNRQRPPLITVMYIRHIERNVIDVSISNSNGVTPFRVTRHQILQCDVQTIANNHYCVSLAHTKLTIATNVSLAQTKLIFATDVSLAQTKLTILL